MRNMFFMLLSAIAFVVLAASATPAAAACSALEASGGGGSFEAGYGQRGYGMAPPRNCLGPRAGYQRGGAFYPPQQNVRRGQRGHGGGNDRRVQKSMHEYHLHSEQRTHTVVWNVVNKTGVGRSIPSTDSRCWTLPNGNRRCPNQ